MKNQMNISSDISDDICKLCDSPRILKFALRQCHETWLALLGEVDFDQLLIFSLVRNGWPDLLKVLNDNVDELRKHSCTTTAPRIGEPSAKSFFTGLEHLSLSESRRAVAIEIASFLFPEPNSSSRRERLQGVHLSMPNDYWLRMSAVPDLRSDERDQPILKAWSLGDKKSLLAFLEAKHSRKLVSHFARPEFSDLALELLVDHVKFLVAEPSKSGWQEGIIALREALANSYGMKFSDDHVLIERLIECTEIAKSSSLEILTNLEQCFAPRHGNSYLSINDHERMRRAVRSTAVKTLTAPVDTLVGLLENKKQWLLYSVLEFTDRPPSPDNVALGARRWVEDTEDWNDCVDALFRAAKQVPQVVLPQIADLVYRHSSEAATAYLKATAEVLFGHDRLMALVRDIPQASIPNDHFSLALREIAVSESATESNRVA